MEDDVIYVLVADVSDNGRLYYFDGLRYDLDYFIKTSKKLAVPINTQEFNKSKKFIDKQQAEKICEYVNEEQKSFKYHVEEHSY